MIVHRIVEIAERVRAEMVELARRTGAFHQTTLERGCAVASYALASALRIFGSDANLVVGCFRGRNHCWVEVGLLVVDITATQFGSDFYDVEICMRGGDYVPECVGPESFASLGWCYDQDPKTYEDELDTIVGRVSGEGRAA